ncbi:hypothetical protein [Caldibacillus debilis]|uniref:hypothetical protein n=1 Tax=Caldibacillus debilis TaxID=301148 RepID=UPI00036337AA|nr:hypothetical protein [Caldibacillus debilis]
MMQKSCPDWLRQAIDQLYNEQAAQIAKQTKFDALNQAQRQLEEKLKTELAFPQFQCVLEWEEVMNRRHTLEIEQIYWTGIKTGMRMLLELQKFIAEDGDLSEK